MQWEGGPVLCSPREEIAHIFSGIRGLAGVGPRSEALERSGSRLQFDLLGFGGCWRGDAGEFQLEGDNSGQGEALEGLI